jgi:two-component system cell cycle response regulator
VDRRALAVAVVGVVGLGVGIAAALTQNVVLGVVATVVLAVFVVLLWRLVTLLRAARHQIDDLTEKVNELEHDVEEQAKARNDAESQLASRIQLTAMRRATQVNALTDGATGLFSEGYFTVALDARIAAARRNLKPVAVVLIEVIEGLEDTAPKPADPVLVSESINTTLRESDTACRLLDGGYALVLEDTTENGAIWSVERIRRHMMSLHSGLTMWAGVACYPAHGLTTEEVLDRADLALDMAREWRQDRIEVASADS